MADGDPEQDCSCEESKDRQSPSIPLENWTGLSSFALSSNGNAQDAGDQSTKNSDRRCEVVDVL